MTDIAKHIRIFSADPDDDFVNKRTSAVKAIEDVYKKSNSIDNILALVNNIAKAAYGMDELDPSLVDTVEKALKKQSSSFVAEGQELQISTCALIAALQYLNKTTDAGITAKLTIAEVFALGIWSAFSFQSVIEEQPKTEVLRNEILNDAKRIIQNDALTTRTRQSIIDLTSITNADDQPTFAANIVKAISPLLEKLKTNATLDREEIDILWWKLNDWSTIAEKSYSQLNAVQGAIAKGLDLSGLLRRVPHLSHYRVIGITDETLFDGNEITGQLGDLLPAIKSHLSSTAMILKNPEVFPLLNLINGHTQAVSFIEQKRSLKEWASRSLLEGAIMHMEKFLKDGN